MLGERRVFFERNSPDLAPPRNTPPRRRGALPIDTKSDQRIADHPQPCWVRTIATDRRRGSKTPIDPDIFLPAVGSGLYAALYRPKERPAPSDHAGRWAMQVLRDSGADQDTLDEGETACCQGARTTQHQPFLRTRRTIPVRDRLRGPRPPEAESDRLLLDKIREALECDGATCNDRWRNRAVAAPVLFSTP